MYSSQNIISVFNSRRMR